MKRARFVVHLGCCALVLALQGCVSRKAAKAQAHEAFLAGREQALSEVLRQRAGPSVNVIGPVTTPVLAWTEGLTVAKAILDAGYHGQGEPRQITILRSGYAISVDPQQLLSGQDVPLQAGDILQITP
ncbi:MAG TPA: hypothetical protein VHH88_13965 [Verrucomicrobiae bacterium]|nr:hypothetical protein [Verrucomicrobiae bacterium]